MLGPLYRRLGDIVKYEAVGGAAPRDVRVLFSESGEDMLDGTHRANVPTLRLPLSEVPDGVSREDAFTINGTLYRAAEDGSAINSGDELFVPLKRVRQP